MFTKLRLERFKNFRSAELALGPFTLLVGTNAAGKSNIRDAFWFLHGLGRGYDLPEIFGEVRSEGGELAWKGVRGGTREIAFNGAPTFEIEAWFYYSMQFRKNHHYQFEVLPGTAQVPPRFVRGATFNIKDRLESFANELPNNGSIASVTMSDLFVQLGKEYPDTLNDMLASAKLHSMRFLDLIPDSMRRPCFPGQTTLGDRGENLSAVLKDICDDVPRKQALLDWIRELTPMDASDIEFTSDVSGRILLSLVEANGQRISAESVSDGTLRFLGLVAALMGPKPAKFYFIEEIETGVHPARLALLLQLLEHHAYKKKDPIQIVGTTHSPLLLALVSERTRESASLIYRLPGEAEGRIRRIMEIPEIKRVLEEQDLARLHASGWLEDAVAFTEEAAATP